MTQHDQGNGHNPSRYQTKHRHTRAGYLTAGEAMRRLKLPRSTFYDYVKRGIIPRTAEGYPEKDIDRLTKEFGKGAPSLSSQTQQACPQASHPEGTLPPSPSHHTERTAMRFDPFNWSGLLTIETLAKIATALQGRLRERTWTRIEINGAFGPDYQKVIEEVELTPTGVFITGQHEDHGIIGIFDTHSTWHIGTGTDCHVMLTRTTVTADWKMPAGHRIRYILVIDPLKEEEKGESDVR